MKHPFYFLFRLFAFWLLVFVLQKLLFMSFNHTESSTMPATLWLKIIYHGLPLDLSACAYLMIIPALLFIIAPFFGIRYLAGIMNAYVLVMLFIVLFLGVVDMNLYSYWGLKLDATPLHYLKNTNEVLASVGIYEIILLTLLFVALFFIFRFVYLRMVVIRKWQNRPFNFTSSIIALICTLLLIIPARGGVGIVSLNPGSVYFHQNIFANHSALNVTWNVLYTLVEGENLRTSHQFMPEETARELFSQVHPQTTPSAPRIIKPNANILLIVLEGFSNKIIEALGGQAGITPRLNQLCSESLVFSNFFASGDRSDKGLVSIYSGFPAQPLTTIINYPNKTQHLPFLTEPFHANGYQTAFYYGGNINFANFRSYFTHKSMNRIVSINDFPKKLNIQKWGVPDEYVYARLLSDMDTVQHPFFFSVFTLSSHDPFDVPGSPNFDMTERDAKSKNGFYYADQCLGDFITAAKRKSWWNETLVIITADHGSRSPGNTPYHVREKFEIPMLWLGGALMATDSAIATYGSHVDIAATLFGQFGYSSAFFSYSKDMLSLGTRGYAYYAWNNGFGFFVEGAGLVWDNRQNKFIMRSGSQVARWQDYGKAIQQLSTTEFLQN